MISFPAGNKKRGESGWKKGNALREGNIGHFSRTPNDHPLCTLNCNMVIMVLVSFLEVFYVLLEPFNDKEYFARGATNIFHFLMQ